MIKIKEKMIISLLILVFVILSIQLPDRINKLKNYMDIKKVISEINNF
jgi:hypothetical protein